MAQTIANFFDALAAGREVTFQAEPWYNAAGDSIHYHWQEEEYYRDRIDDKLTVYRSVASANAVGCEIKGITALLTRLGQFGIAIGRQDGTPLAMFLFISSVVAAEAAANAAERQKTYQYVLEHVGKKKVEVPKGAMAAA